MRLMTASLLALCLVFAVSAEGPASDDRIAEIMELSGINTQIGNHQEAAKASAEQQREAVAAQGGPRLSPEMEAFITEQFVQLFEPKALLEDIHASLTESIDDTTAQAVLTWLKSPLGARIVETEVAASGAEAVHEMNANASALMANTANVERVGRLEQALNLGDFTTRMSLNIQLAAGLSILATQPGFDQSALAQLVNETEKMRPVIEQSVMPQLMLSLLHTYEPLSDADFEAYLAFVESPPGIRFNLAVMEAFDEAFVTAAKSLGKRLMDVNRRRGA